MIKIFFPKLYAAVVEARNLLGILLENLELFEVSGLISRSTLSHCKAPLRHIIKSLGRFV